MSDKKQLRHLDLFSGIGGFALAASWCGFITGQFVELNTYCRRVLSKNFPLTPIHDDIKTFKTREKYDIVTGGFPCQPFSKSGKRKGSDDSRYLWPEMFRVVKDSNPTFVVAENVFGILTTESGDTFEKVCIDLESYNYQVQPVIIPSSGVGAFHRRDRVWIIGIKNDSLNSYPNSVGSHRKKIHQPGGTKFSHKQIRLPGPLVSKSVRKGSNSRIFRDVDVIPNRVDRLRSLGNSICPQIAFEIFKSLVTP